MIHDLVGDSSIVDLVWLEPIVAKHSMIEGKRRESHPVIYTPSTRATATSVSISECTDQVRLESNLKGGPELRSESLGSARSMRRDQRKRVGCTQSNKIQSRFSSCEVRSQRKTGAYMIKGEQTLSASNTDARPEWRVAMPRPPGHRSFALPSVLMHNDSDSERGKRCSVPRRSSILCFRLPFPCTNPLTRGHSAALFRCPLASIGAPFIFCTGRM